MLEDVERGEEGGAASVREPVVGRGGEGEDVDAGVGGGGGGGAGEGAAGLGGGGGDGEGEEGFLLDGSGGGHFDACFLGVTGLMRLVGWC